MTTRRSLSLFFSLAFALALALIAAPALAQNTVTSNQGAPGHFGPWPVDVGSSSITTPIQMRLRDGTGTTLSSVYTDGDARGTPKGPICMWDDGTNIQTPLSDSGGRPQSNIVGSDDATVLGVIATAAVIGTPNGLMCLASDGTNYRMPRVDATGRAQPNIIGADDTTVMTVSATGTAIGTPNGLVSMWSDATNFQTPRSDTGGRPQVNLVGSDDATVAAVDAQNNLQTVSYANTSVTQTEVLVLNSASTATPASALSGRRSIEIQNRGPNSIFCKPGGSGVVNTTREIRTGDSWSLDLGSAVAVGCIAGTADQVTTAATVVTELR